ncbi:major facilitator superfamily domain-containing protein [Scheffersomyces xylosifermentans]|uniref:major facilitator superfamily domain-containing protein n=1 Tax=Scheffersomyces xylosifermentans TaxID=1304137 RepID=UPI00315D6909
MEEISMTQKQDGKSAPVVVRNEAPSNSHLTELKPTQDELSPVVGKPQTKLEFTEHGTEENSSIFWNCIILSTTSFPLGWDVGTMGNLIISNHFPFHNLADLQTGLLISSFNIGCLIGCLTLARISTYVKLRTLIHSASLFYLVGTILEMFSLHYPYLWLFVAGRLICGINCGTLCAVGPMYMLEVMGENFPRRDLYFSMWQSEVCISILVGNVLSVLQPNIYPTVVEISKIIFVILLDTLICTVPDLKHPTQDDARESKAFKITVLEHFPEGNSQLLKCCLVMSFQQLTGINYFFYFGSIVFASPLACIFMSLVNLIGSFSSGFVLQYLGLKHVLAVCSFLMALVMGAYAMMGILSSSQHQVLIILSMVFILLFSLSWGPGSGILNNLLSKNDPKIISVAVSLNWITNWFVAIITPTMIKLLGFSYGFFFACNLVAMGCFIMKFIPRH